MHLREIDANLLVTLDALLVDASVTRAAERLGRSASAISHALAKLREIFADELFVRAGQRLVPTAKALELAPTVHVILAGMESLLRPSKPFDPSETSRDFAVATSEAGELMLVQPLRQRLQQLAPSVRVGWMPSSREENIDALRNGRSHFVIDIEGMPLAGARHPRAQAVATTCSSRSRARAIPAARAKPKAAAFAASDHIAVHGLPTIDLIDRALGRAASSPAPSPSRVSSVLVGLLLALNSDALLTVPASLAAILETAIRAQPRSSALPAHRLPVQADVAFELRPRRMPRLGARGIRQARTRDGSRRLRVSP